MSRPEAIRALIPGGSAREGVEAELARLGALDVPPEHKEALDSAVERLRKNLRGLIVAGQ